MKSLTRRLVLLSALATLPLSLFAGSLKTATLDVKNMTCAVCRITVKKALEKVPGVTSATVNFDKKQAQVYFDAGVATVDKLREATANGGYPSTLTGIN